MTTSKFKTICVLCGISPGKKKKYQDAAINLGKELVCRNIDLVYGGGNIGLMGLISQAVLDGGSHVLGVIHKALMDKEISGVTIGEIKPVENMHQRKAEISLHADAFVAIPRGYGTLEKLFEVISWPQLGIHDKPIGLLNIDGYCNSLLSFIEQIVEEGFIKQNAHHIITSASNAKELIEKPEDYYPCHDEVSSKLNWNSEQLKRSQRSVSFSNNAHGVGEGNWYRLDTIHGVGRLTFLANGIMLGFLLQQCTWCWQKELTLP
ncbi:probable cytokinin riboside 5'-monophosphate phosphoribohydrolase LOGL10 [Dioscorea cayenensis subsp. rotundata]|uniref:Cytokinin riboside 5'-monophosphate phosphoribohydrolase n=1 Tax=Dioscorea cayennensis subsp. rotundata TaxID=55577 RepID=A0AB40D5D2_DIOCR|nr:probable cytokinin riboside 5'-monophosphate phosphoribohydrolase LOGL10 [Dioscorea cayenensis subsp. rotundata]